MALQGPRSLDDLFCLIAQFLDEINFQSVAQRIKEETHLVFNLKKFEFAVQNGLWFKAEEYLSMFVGSRDEELSLVGIIYEIRKQKYLEALMRANEDVAKAIFNNEVVVLDFLPKMELQDDIKKLHHSAANIEFSIEYDISIARSTLMSKLKRIMKRTPCIHKRYKFCHLQGSSLWQLIDKRYNLAIGNESVGSGEQSTGSQSSTSQNLGRVDEGASTERRSTGLIDEACSSSHMPEIKVVKDSAQLQLLRLPFNGLMDDRRALRLTYLKSGNAIVGLLSKGCNVVWKWPQCDLSSDGQANVVVTAKLEQPVMLNERPDANPLIDESCFALSFSDLCLLSASDGGKISMFSLTTYERLVTSVNFMPTPPAVTFLAFCQDDNVIAVGKHDSSIDIYNNADVVRVITTLQGHTKMVTGLAFSLVLNSMVSSGADAQIILWSMENWQKKAATSLKVPRNRAIAAVSKTEIQFHNNESHLLVVHETQLSIYNATTLECTGLPWIVGKYNAPIHQATFSFDCELVFSGFVDGSVRIFTAEDLQPKCLIKVTAFIPSFGSNGPYRCPIVVAAHPNLQHQIAVGLTDGQAFVVQLPSELRTPKELGHPKFDEEFPES